MFTMPDKISLLNFRLSVASESITSPCPASKFSYLTKLRFQFSGNRRNSG
jgi:hypothetical protein